MMYCAKYIKARNTRKLHGKPTLELAILLRNHKLPEGNKRATENRFMNNVLAKERLDIFEQRLRRRAITQYDAWLGEKNEPACDPATLVGWDRSWNMKVEAVPDTGRVPEPPTKKQSAMRALLLTGKGSNMESDEVRRRLAAEITGKELEGLSAQALANARAGGAKIEKSAPPAKGAPKKGRMGINADLLAKIRGKAKARNIMKTVCDTKDTIRKKRLEHIPYLVSLIRSLFTESKRTAMLASQFVPMCRKRHRDQLPEDELMAQIAVLLEIAPYYFSSRKLMSGKLMYKLNLKADQKKVFADAKAAIKKIEV